MDAIEVAGRSADGRHHALITRPLEIIEARPVIGKVPRLEDVDGDRRAIRIQDERRVAEARAPTALEQPSVDLAREPSAVQAAQLMVVRAAGSQGSVRDQSVERFRCSWSNLRLTVSTHVSLRSPYPCHP